MRQLTPKNSDGQPARQVVEVLLRRPRRRGRRRGGGVVPRRTPAVQVEGKLDVVAGLAEGRHGPVPVVEQREELEQHDEQSRAHGPAVAVRLQLFLRSSRLRRGLRRPRGLDVVALATDWAERVGPRQHVRRREDRVGPLQRPRRVLARLIAADRGLHVRDRRERRRGVAHDGRRDHRPREGNRLRHLTVPRLRRGESPPQRGQLLAQGIRLRRPPRRARLSSHSDDVAPLMDSLL